MKETFLEEFLPIYDVSDAVGTVVAADAATTWKALMSADLVEVGRAKPMVGALGAVRAMPEIVASLLHGEAPPSPPEHLTLREIARLPALQGGWVLLGERAGEEIALGLVGKFWRPVIAYAEVNSNQFRDFNEPGYAKTVYALSAHEAPGGGTLLKGEMRTATTDETARKWFRRYWTFGVGSGAHILVGGLLEYARESAEA